ncbi:hypothetical protein D3C80_686550 [compost metagenome]
MIEDILHANSNVQVRQLRAEIIGRAAAEQHVARDAAVAAIGTFAGGVGVVGELVALVSAVQVQLPLTFAVANAQRAFVTRGERHAIAFVRPIFADFRIDKGVSCIHVKPCQCRVQTFECVLHAGLDSLVAGFATGDH